MVHIKWATTFFWMGLSFPLILPLSVTLAKAGGPLAAPLAAAFNEAGGGCAGMLSPLLREPMDPGVPGFRRDRPPG